MNDIETRKVLSGYGIPEDQLILDQPLELRGVDLHKKLLVGASLSGANLRQADLRETNLMLADLRDVDLRGADLRGATLIGADLSRSLLNGADLRWVDMRAADFSQADLSEVVGQPQPEMLAGVRGLESCRGAHIWYLVAMAARTDPAVKKNK